MVWCLCTHVNLHNTDQSYFDLQLEIVFESVCSILNIVIFSFIFFSWHENVLNFFAYITVLLKQGSITPQKMSSQPPLNKPYGNILSYTFVKSTHFNLDICCWLCSNRFLSFFGPFLCFILSACTLQINFTQTFHLLLDSFVSILPLTTPKYCKLIWGWN